MSLEPKGWLARLTSGLSRSSDKLAGGFRDLFAKRKLDGDAIEALEELLITADLGVKVAARLAANFSKTRFDKDVDEQEVRKALAADIADLLEPVAKPLNIDTATKPHVILVCGVNGSGKTTTIGKLAASFKQAGHSAMLVAGDTLFLDGCGRMDLPGSDPAAMYRSLHDTLAKVPDSAVLFPGHRYSFEPSATMGQTRQMNYVFKPRSEQQWLMMFGQG